MTPSSNACGQIGRFARVANECISRAAPEALDKGLKAAQLRKNLGKKLSNIDGARISVKDNICTTDLPTTCGSRILKDFSSPFKATVIDRLHAAGAIVDVKTNLDEFGMGSHSSNSASGAVINPYRAKEHSAGGSSGGSAVAVALGTCHSAIGTDTGGSVRLPAAYCSIVGFKPSYGRISRYGVVAYANSLDTVGLLGPTIGHVRDLFAVLDSPDRRDPTCLTSSERESFPVSALKNGKLRFGIPIEYNTKELNESVRKSWVSTAKALIDLGHEVVPVHLPATRAALAAYYVIAPAEASSNLAKFDGLRYGRPSPLCRSKDNVLFSRTRHEGLGEEVRRRILLGSYNLSSTAIDNYFVQSQRVRRLVKQEFNGIFRQRHPLSDDSTVRSDGVDLLLTPTAPTMPPLLAEVRAGSITERYRDDVFTVPASLAGLPAVSFPLPDGQTTNPPGSDFEPSVQLMGQYGHDDLVLYGASILKA